MRDHFSHSKAMDGQKQRRRREGEREMGLMKVRRFLIPEMVRYSAGSANISQTQKKGILLMSRFLMKVKRIMDIFLLLFILFSSAFLPFLLRFPATPSPNFSSNFVMMSFN